MSTPIKPLAAIFTSSCAAKKSARSAMPVAAIAEAKSSAGGRSVSAQPTLKPDLKSAHWEGDTVIGAAHKQAFVTLVERKSGYAVLAKVKNKTSDLVSSAIITKLNAVTPLVKTLTFDNGKEFAEHARIDTALQSTMYFADPFASVGNADQMKTSMVYCVNTSPKRDRYLL